MFFLGCRDCCEPPVNCDDDIRGREHNIVSLWPGGVMNDRQTVCGTFPFADPNFGPLYYDFFYEPTKLRLSPPDGLGQLASDYFVYDRANSRHVNQRGVRCDPFRIVPGVPGNGLEEPASLWAPAGLGTVFGFSSSDVFAPGKLTGHARAGTRWPSYDWDIKQPPPQDITLWDAIAQCAGFVPRMITVKLNINWRLEVGLFAGHINLYGALWGENESKTDVNTTWEIGIKANVYDIDEPAVRAMLAGDIGGRTLWSRSTSQTIPGNAELNGNNGGPPPFPVPWLGLVDTGSSTAAEFDVSAELQNTNMLNQLFWLGPMISPPFGEPTSHFGDVLFSPPVYNPPRLVPYHLGYWRTGRVAASFVSFGQPPPGGAIVDNFFVYR